MDLSELYKSHLIDVGKVCQSIRPSCIKIVTNHLTPIPAIILVSWDGMMKERIKLGGTDDIKWESSYMEIGPSTRLQLQIFDDIAELDRWVVRGACTLGAWDVIRSMRPESIGERIGMNKQLVEPSGSEFNPVDYEEVRRCLGLPGVVIWKFRPVFGSLRESLIDDNSLNDYGKRSPNYPIPAYIQVSETRPVVQYRFGEERRIFTRQSSELESVSR